MKRILIAAATAAALATGSLAGAAPALAGSGLVEVHSPGPWNGGNGNWNGGNGKWGHKWQAGKRCEPVVRWKLVGYGWHKYWQPVVVRWDCHRGRGHHRW